MITQPVVSLSIYLMPQGASLSVLACPATLVGIPAELRELIHEHVDNFKDSLNLKESCRTFYDTCGLETLAKPMSSEDADNLILWADGKATTGVTDHATLKRLRIYASKLREIHMPPPKLAPRDIWAEPLDEESTSYDRKLLDQYLSYMSHGATPDLWIHDNGVNTVTVDSIVHKICSEIKAGRAGRPHVIWKHQGTAHGITTSEDAQLLGQELRTYSNAIKEGLDSRLDITHLWPMVDGAASPYTDVEISMPPSHEAHAYDSATSYGNNQSNHSQDHETFSRAVTLHQIRQLDSIGDRIKHDDESYTVNHPRLEKISLASGDYAATVEQVLSNRTFDQSVELELSKLYRTPSEAHDPPTAKQLLGNERLWEVLRKHPNVRSVSLQVSAHDCDDETAADFEKPEGIDRIVLYSTALKRKDGDSKGNVPIPLPLSKMGGIRFREARGFEGLRSGDEYEGADLV